MKDSVLNYSIYSLLVQSWLLTKLTHTTVPVLRTRPKIDWTTYPLPLSAHTLTLRSVAQISIKTSNYSFSWTRTLRGLGRRVHTAFPAQWHPSWVLEQELRMKCSPTQICRSLLTSIAMQKKKIHTKPPPSFSVKLKQTKKYIFFIASRVKIR